MRDDDEPTGPMPLNPCVIGGAARLPAPRDGTPGPEAVEAMADQKRGDRYTGWCGRKMTRKHGSVGAVRIRE
jgi:hypothetical protein